MRLIDEPEMAMRETVDKDYLDELAADMAELGLINAIEVQKRGERYEIVHGHCRFLAAQSLSWETIPARIEEENEELREARKISENYIRRDPNIAEEALYLSKVCETRCGGDVDKLCAMIRKSRNYVESRLLLAEGDPAVFEAVLRNQIRMGVALELNKFKVPGVRLAMLDSAIRGGATADLVRTWRQQYDNPVLQAAIDGAGTPTPEQAGATIEAHEMRCVCCNLTNAPWDMELIYVHRTGCGTVLLRFLQSIGATFGVRESEDGSNG